MRTHWKVESQSKLKYRKISDTFKIFCCCGQSLLTTQYNTGATRPQRPQACSWSVSSHQTELTSGHQQDTSTTYLPSLNLKIVLSFQGWRAWQRFISLMPQNLQDVKKSLVVLRGITNIQFKCRLIRGAQKGSDLRVFQGCCVNGYSYRAQARR